MSNLYRNDKGSFREPGGLTGRRLGLVTVLFVVLALLVAACGSAAEPTAVPVAQATTVPTTAPTAVPTAVPTTEPTSPPAPTDTPVAEGMPVPGDTPVPEMEVLIEPSVTVSDQEIVDDKVVVAEVMSDGPGWLVIHAQADGKPGPILGYSPVVDGANSDLVVAIDTANATETLYAMLHTDAGAVGAWEFPGGPDTPVTVNGQVVTPAFGASKPVAASESAPTSAPTAPSSAGIPIPAGAVVVTGDEAEVEMEDFKFNPLVLVIRPGTTVKFANKDEVQHTATSDTGVFDSGYLSKGEAYSYTFTEPGIYPYYCIPHGGPGGQGMAATIIVQP